MPDFRYTLSGAQSIYLQVSPFGAWFSAFFVLSMKFPWTMLDSAVSGQHNMICWSFLCLYSQILCLLRNSKTCIDLLHLATWESNAKDLQLGLLPYTSQYWFRKKGTVTIETTLIPSSPRHWAYMVPNRCFYPLQKTMVSEGVSC